MLDIFEKTFIKHRRLVMEAVSPEYKRTRKTIFLDQLQTAIQALQIAYKQTNDPAFSKIIKASNMLVKDIAGSAKLNLTPDQKSRLEMMGNQIMLLGDKYPSVEIDGDQLTDYARNYLDSTGANFTDLDNPKWRARNLRTNANSPTHNYDEPRR
jgi:hypothetical protein